MHIKEPGQEHGSNRLFVFNQQQRTSFNRIVRELSQGSGMPLEKAEDMVTLAVGKMLEGKMPVQGDPDSFYELRTAFPILDTPEKVNALPVAGRPEGWITAMNTALKNKSTDQTKPAHVEFDQDQAIAFNNALVAFEVVADADADNAWLIAIQIVTGILCGIEFDRETAPAGAMDVIDDLAKEFRQLMTEELTALPEPTDEQLRRWSFK